MSDPAILETALYADDIDAAEAFYRDVIGLERVLKKDGAHVFFRCGGAILLIFNPAATRDQGGGALPVPPHGATGPGHFCLAAADDAEVGAWRKRLERAGVAIEADFRWPNKARSLYFRDPAGNSLEIAETRLWFTQ